MKVNILKKENGIALFMALLIILISALLTMLLAGISIINLKLCSNLSDYKKAVYAAEAGSEYARALVIKNAPDIPDVENPLTLNNNSSFYIDIESSDDNSNLYIIESKGIYCNNSRIYKTDITINNE